MALEDGVGSIVYGPVAGDVALSSPALLCSLDECQLGCGTSIGVQSGNDCVDIGIIKCL